MVREDLFARSTSVIDKGTSSPFAYATALADRFAPWPFAVAAAAALAWRDRRRRRAEGEPAPHRWLRRRRGREVQLLLWLWIAVPLAMFSLARTQHHWYLDPIYPACAILAAAALLFLVGGAPRQLKAAALVGFVALPLALCEARVLHRVLVRDHMPPSQRFLYALERAAGSRCHELRTTFPLRHSERFILEVVDGFRVVEGAGGDDANPANPASGSGDASGSNTAGAPPGSALADGPGRSRGTPAPGVCVLVSRLPAGSGGRHRRHGAGPPVVPGWKLERQSDAYALFAGGMGTVPGAHPGGAAPE
jgi:hypothetical protein